LARPGHRAAANTPPESSNRLSQPTTLDAAFTLWARVRPPELSSRDHLCVRLRCGPVTRSRPFDDPVNGLQVIGFPPPCHPSYKASGFCLGGIHFPLNAPAFAGRTPRTNQNEPYAVQPKAQTGPKERPQRLGVERTPAWAANFPPNYLPSMLSPNHIA
jgi:hypothetical protein